MVKASGRLYEGRGAKETVSKEGEENEEQASSHNVAVGLNK
jgi:hypothetical protein